MFDRNNSDAPDKGAAKIKGMHERGCVGDSLGGSRVAVRAPINCVKYNGVQQI